MIPSGWRWKYMCTACAFDYVVDLSVRKWDHFHMAYGDAVLSGDPAALAARRANLNDVLDLTSVMYMISFVPVTELNPSEQATLVLLKMQCAKRVRAPAVSGIPSAAASDVGDITAATASDGGGRSNKRKQRRHRKKKHLAGTSN
jgi:hypothetical protein